MCLVDDVVQVFAMKCHSIKSMWSAGHLLAGAGGGGPREHDTKRVCAGTTVSDSWSSEGRPGFVSSWNKWLNFRTFYCVSPKHRSSHSPNHHHHPLRRTSLLIAHSLSSCLIVWNCTPTHRDKHWHIHPSIRFLPHSRPMPLLLGNSTSPSSGTEEILKRWAQETTDAQTMSYRILGHRLLRLRWRNQRTKSLRSSCHLIFLHLHK